MSCAYSYIPILIRPDNNYYFVGDCHSKHMFMFKHVHVYTCTCLHMYMFTHVHVLYLLDLIITTIIIVGNINIIICNF